MVVDRSKKILRSQRNRVEKFYHARRIITTPIVKIRRIIDESLLLLFFIVDSNGVVVVGVVDFILDVG